MPGKTLELFVKGFNGETTVIRIDEGATIAQLCQKVSDITHVNHEDLRIMFVGKCLRTEDEQGKVQTLQDYNIVDQSTLFVVLRLLA